MKRPVLILVSGPPAAGKTTLSRRIAEEFRLPLVAKDAIKETLFDTLGLRDPAWRQDFGRASIVLLWQFVETLLQTGHDVIAESNFHASLDSGRIARLQEKHQFLAWQLHCTAPVSRLWERATERERSGARHSGHHGIGLSREEFEASLAQGLWEPLHIAGPILILDTTDWESLDWERIRLRVQALLQEAAE